jgi:hypothetical protein
MTLAEEAERLTLVDGGLRNALALEAEKYLDAVEFFRGQGCEPRWAPELEPDPLMSCNPRPGPRAVRGGRRRTSC